MLFEPMGCLNKARPAILGAITVVTTAVLFSKSSRDRSQHEDVPHEALTTAGFAHGPDTFRIGGSHWVKVTRTLSVEQLQDCELTMLLYDCRIVQLLTVFVI